MIISKQETEAASLILYVDIYWKINHGIVWKFWLPNNAITLRSPKDRQVEIPNENPKTGFNEGKSIFKNLFTPLIPRDEQSRSCFLLRKMDFDWIIFTVKGKQSITLEKIKINTGK